MEHPKEITLISKAKSNNVVFDLAHFPGGERNIFTWKPLIESVYETKKVVQVIAQDAYATECTVTYYPKNEFMLWYFKKEYIDHLPNHLVDLESQKRIISFAFYNLDPSRDILNKYYDSTDKNSSAVKCCRSTLIVSHVVLYSALCYCVTKLVANGF
jgi:hypothetical protein